MKINMQNPNPGTRFYFDEDKPEDGYVGLRICNGKALRDIHKATIKKRTEYKKGQRFEVEEVDEDKRSQMINDYIITEWSGITDDFDQPIECNAENKNFLMLNVIDFSRFISDCLEKLAEDHTEQQGVREKN